MIEDVSIIARLSFLVNKALTDMNLPSADELVIKNITSTLLGDEKISIDWRNSGVTIVDPKAYPPIRFGNEFSTAEEMKKFCNMHAPVDIIQGFVNKDKDELTFVEGKALAFMICQLYKRFCI